MNTESLKNMTRLYLDGELERNKETLLFTQLSQDTEARDYFKSMSILKNAVLETENEFSQQLEERIFYSLKKNKISRFDTPGIFKVVSYSLVILLVLINIYLLGRIDSNNNKIEEVEKVVDRQNHLIELLYNSLPPTEVKPVKQSNQIIN